LRRAGDAGQIETLGVGLCLEPIFDRGNGGIHDRNSNPPDRSRAALHSHEAARLRSGGRLAAHCLILAPKSFFSARMKYVSQVASIRTGLKLTRSMLYLAMLIIWSRMSKYNMERVNFSPVLIDALHVVLGHAHHLVEDVARPSTT